MDIKTKSPSASAPKKRKQKSEKGLDSKVPKVQTSSPSSPVVSAQPKRKLISKRKLKVDSTIAEMGDVKERYPILTNEPLISKFLKVPMSNNQKGRIRQTIKDSLQGTNKVLVPDIIHNKIQSILQASENLTDSELRRVRILYNFLKTALKGEDVTSDAVENDKPKKKKEKKDGDSKKTKEIESGKVKDGVKGTKEPLVQKVKGPKRYVVFLGNLPLDVNKDKIMNHFSEMNEHIVDIRIPKIVDGKKSAIAYLELSNEPSYEFALSKHHSMLGSKRINVLYTAQKKGKITKADAKSKSAKLIALQKSGKLIGSIPLAKKRSQRRLKMKQAQAKLVKPE